MMDLVIIFFFVALDYGFLFFGASVSIFFLKKTDLAFVNGKLCPIDTVYQMGWKLKSN